jgi:hypothetical protein
MSVVITALVNELTAIRGERDALMAEIERLRSLLRESISVPVQLNANVISPVAWRKDYTRRVREALGDE